MKLQIHYLVSKLSSTKNLKNDHILLRRVRNIAQKCSENLYSNKEVSLEHIEIISVIIEEFVDNFHHGKGEKAYFPETKEKDDGFAKDIRKLLIEHELGRRIANMLRREIKVLKEKRNIDDSTGLPSNEEGKLKEPVARFLKSYAVFIDDHTGNEDKFFELVEQSKSLSTEEDKRLLEHYELCKNQVGGEARIREMLRLIGYLEEQDWMKLSDNKHI